MQINRRLVKKLFLHNISNNQLRNTAANLCKTPKQFFPKGPNFDLT